MKKNKFLPKIFFIVLFFSIFLFSGNTYSWNLPGLNIITRQQRGANESFRLYPENFTVAPVQPRTEQYLNELKEVDLDQIRSQYQREVAVNFLLANYPGESKVDKFNQHFSGRRLRWTESIKDSKTKIIIHHTAKNSSGISTMQDAIKEIQNIYKYHTVNRGWGDIGYNFIIDPFGNIYEGRAGGEGVIGAHAKRNNSSSIGITLLGNFEEEQIPPQALSALIRLLTSLSQKYNINPNDKVVYHKDSNDFPYIRSQEGFAIGGHRDAGNTACPGKNLYVLLPQIRQQVSSLLNSTIIPNIQNSSSPASDRLIAHIISRSETNSDLTYHGAVKLREQMKKSIENLKDKYPANKSNPKSISKINYKLSSQEAKSLMESNISVLLYELTFNFTNYQIGCLGTCEFILDGKKIISPSGEVKINNNQISLTIENNIYIGNSLKINSEKDLIAFRNYNRKSFLGKPRNVFRGSIDIKKQDVKDKNSRQTNRFAVINTLPFYDYMKGIVETNDSETIEKNKVIALVSKTYALFYLKNIHPNIPSGSEYNAVDDPDVFQKYVGAGAEITLTKRPKALSETRDLLILFDGFIPILPYFNCSPGFTYSAQEKRGRNDTPYLISNLDTARCQDFSGHGVGMSGRGAEYRAKKGWNYKEILQYYYPGLDIKKLD